MKRAPPFSLPTRSSPWCASTNPFAIARPRPAPAPGVRGGVSLVRNVEDARQIRFGNTAAAVLHRDVHILGELVVDTGFDDYAAVGRRMPDRVLEQVPQRAQHLGRRHVQLGWGTDQPALQPHTLCRRHRRRARERIREQITERDVRELQPQHARLCAAELEQVVDERGEVVDLLAHRAQVSRDAFCIVDHAVLERLDDRAHARERGSQVVRDPGDQLPSRRFERLLARPRVRKPRLCCRELGRECRELGRRVSFELDRRVAFLADAARAREQRPARGADACAEHEGDDDADASRSDQHDGERREVVLGDEHRPRCRVGTAGDRDDGAAREGDDLRADRLAAQGTQRERAGREAEQRHSSGDARELEGVGRVHGSHR